MNTTPSPQVLLEAFRAINKRFPDSLLTGSLSIALQGFKIRRVPKDLDIIIFDTDILDRLDWFIPEFKLVGEEPKDLVYQPDGIRFPFEYWFKDKRIKIDFFSYPKAEFDDFFFTTIDGVPCAKYSHPFQFKVEYALFKGTKSAQKHYDDIIFFLNHNANFNSSYSNDADGVLNERVGGDNLISNFIKKDVIFFDLETTGKNVSKDKIVEIYARKILSSGDVTEFHCLLNPGIPIEEGATQLHGISNEDVCEAQKFADIADDLFVFFEGCEVAGFNIKNFDIPILNKEFFDSLGKSPFSVNQVYLDCYRLINKIEPRKLEDLYFKFTSKVLLNAHSASADVDATISIFISILNRNENWLYKDVQSYLIDENTVLDFDGKFYKDQQGIVKFNFGKNKDLPISSDEDYLQWMLRQDFSQNTLSIIDDYFLEKKRKIRELFSYAKLKNSNTKCDSDSVIDDL